MKLKVTTPPVPRGLSVESRKFWRDMLETYAIDDVAGLKYLQRACESLDLLRMAQRELKKGVVVRDKKGSTKANPAAAVEKEAHRMFIESMKMLNLDIEPLQARVGRPGGPSVLKVAR